VNTRIGYLLLTGFTVAMVRCGAQQQTQPDGGAVKTTSEVIQVKPIAADSNTSKIVTNQFFLKSMSAMNYDMKIGSATSVVPLLFDSGLTSRVTRADVRSGRLGIEQAERINLMQMNEYRLRNSLQQIFDTRETFHPSGSEMIFNPK
jgi:hypothetical protein